MQTKKEIGEFGEAVAENFLRADNYEILAKNYRTRIGEIDIIAKKDKKLAFVEVKTRTSEIYGLPQESITKRKLIRMLRSAMFYLAENNIKNNSFRIDVISVQLEKTGKVARIEHIKNVLND